MAPPPPASLPLTQRLLAVAQTLQFAWFIGHLVLLLCLSRFSMSWIRTHWWTRTAQFYYRTAFVAAAVTYGIVVYKTLRARAKAGMKLSPQTVVPLLGDENVQYLLMSLVWLFSPAFLLALLPYAMYSVFHFATYTRSTVIPTVIPPTTVNTEGGKTQIKNFWLADYIGTFVKEYYDTSMSVVAGLEIALWLRLLLSAIAFSSRSWIMLGLYTIFLRARCAQSTHVSDSFLTLEARIDSYLGAQGIPPAARQAWEVVKGGIRQFHEATDISRYGAGGVAPPKKTS
ncbi:unnamed protein product [Discula destructiva]